MKMKRIMIKLLNYIDQQSVNFINLIMENIKHILFLGLIVHIL